MLRLLYLIIFLTTTLRVFSQTTYYVDGCSGNDGSSDPSSQSTPWKSINKVNGELTRFNAGDSILFKTGCTYTEGLDLQDFNQGGSISNPITFGTYGPGSTQKPKIDLTTEVTGSWTKNGDVWSTDITSGGNEVRSVFVDGVRLDVSHSPHDPNDYYHYLASGCSKTGLDVGSSFPLSSTDVEGSRIFMKYARWKTGIGDVSGLSGSTLNVDWSNSFNGGAEVAGSFSEGFGFTLLNKREFVQMGTWATSSSTLYVQLDGNADPNTKEIRVSLDKDFGVNLQDTDGVVIDGFEIFGAKKHGISIWMSAINNVVIRNCDIISPGNDGIGMKGNGQNVLIENNVIRDCPYRGITGRGWDLRSFTFKNNHVEDVCIHPYMVNVDVTDRWFFRGAGISVEAEDCVFEENSLKNIGYIGLQMYGANHIARNNYIENTCFHIDDCGAIYTWNNGNNQISNNIIKESRGTLLGVPDAHYLGAGIYTDDWSHHHTIHDNLLIDVQWGVYLHNSNSEEIYNNVIVHAYSEGFHIQEDDIGGSGNMFDNDIHHNVVWRSGDYSEKMVVLWPIASDGDNPGIANMYENSYYGHGADFGEYMTCAGGCNPRRYSTLTEWMAADRESASSVIGAGWSYEIVQGSGHDIAKDFTLFYNEDTTQDTVVSFTANERYCEVGSGTVVSESQISLAPTEFKLYANCYCNEDGTCNNEENVATCPDEGCAAVCGNTFCEPPAETSSSCPQDCGTTTCPQPCENGVCVVDTCQCNQYWGGDTCDFRVCIHGSCSQTQQNVCDCDLGWTGKACDQVTCTTHGCENGDCVAPDSCDCYDGWTSAGCNVPVCTSCVHGSCNAPETCSCYSGWSGPSCDQFSCDAAPCQNGGVCSGPNTCDCSGTSFGGQTCEISNCNCHHGICNTGPNDCNCDTGYDGSLCETPVCDPTCQNGGSCVAPDDCSCLTGWTGRKCDLAVCSPGCFHGVCTNPPDECACITGWTSSLCDVATCYGSEASSDTVCSQHGICYGPNTCDCDDGFNGLMCNHEVIAGAVCYGIPSHELSVCSARGSCVALDTCKCDPGHTGPRCEVVVTCNGLQWDDPEICAGNGICVDADICRCFAGWKVDVADGECTTKDLSRTLMLVIIVPSASVLVLLCALTLVALIVLIIIKRKKVVEYIEVVRQTIRRSVMPKKFQKLRDKLPPEEEEFDDY